MNAAIRNHVGETTMGMPNGLPIGMPPPAARRGSGRPPWFSFWSLTRRCYGLLSFQVSRGRAGALCRRGRLGFSDMGELGIEAVATAADGAPAEAVAGDAAENVEVGTADGALFDAGPGVVK